MKKVNPAYIAKWFGGALLIGAAILAAMFTVGMMMELWFVPVIGIVACIWILVGLPSRMEKQMSKHAAELEQEFDGMGFSYQHKFTSNSGIFYIDLSGRLGVIWKYNPGIMQFADLSSVKNIRTHDGKMLGGTSLVSCQFELEGKRFKIYTLRVSNGSLKMNSPEVLEAISKADKLCEMLSLAKENAARVGARAQG